MLSDIRYAFRLLRRTPGFTAAAITTLALAVGSNLAILSAIHGLFIRPLAVAHDERLVVIYLTDARLGQRTRHVSHPIYRAWVAEADAFEQLATVTAERFDLTGDGAAQRVDGEVVSANFFETLGVWPTIGRGFTASDTDSGGSFPCVIGYDLWQTRYGGHPDVLGRTIVAGELSFVIVGVMPRTFQRWRRDALLWVPVEGVPRIMSVRDGGGYYLYHVIGRLRRDTTLDAARRQLGRILSPLEARDHGEDRIGVNVVSLREDIFGADGRRLLAFLGIVVALVWVIASANIAALLLARIMERRHELAVRRAIGATRFRVARQLFAEGALLSFAGAAAGLIVAYWSVRLLVAYGPPALAREDLVHVDETAAVAAGAMAVITAAAIVLIPAFQASRDKDSAVLTEARSSATRGSARLQDLFVGAQVTLSAFVLICCGLVVNSYVKLQQVPLGFDPEGVLTARIRPPQNYFGDARAQEQLAALQTALMTEVAALPSVRSIALASDLPVPNAVQPSSITIDGGPRLLNGNPRDRPHTPARHSVSARYFQLVRARLVRGRDFTDRDTSEAPPVAIVSETMARIHWPEQDPVGRRVTFGTRRRDGSVSEPWITIIGVVSDIRYGGPQSPIKPEIYLPLRQLASRELILMATSSREPSALIVPVQRAVKAIDPEIVVYDARPMTDRVADATAEARYRAGMLSALGILAFVLSTSGLYAVVARRVASRRRELAIRVALGASPSALLRLVLRRTAVMLIASATLGLFLALLASRWIASQLFGTSPTDPLLIAMAVGTLVAIGMLAAYLPARRAAQVDRVSTLRVE